MAKLSVNINKIATLRNSRGADSPNVKKVAIDVQRFGAQGVTVHPRPDERHIRYRDVHAIKEIITTEFNIEGNPKEDKFVQLVLEVLPEQVTLVPDTGSQLTSDHGWDTIKESEFLKMILEKFKSAGIRTSLFVDATEKMVEGAKNCGADRIELYTESYAHNFIEGRESAIKPFVIAAKLAHEMKLGINAGHDLSLENLNYLAKNIPHLDEVSIGHALISDALYFGLENTIQMYLRQLNDLG